MFTSLSCAKCGYIFPQNTIPLPCPKCGSNSFKSDESVGGLKLRASIGHSFSCNHIRHAALFTRNSGSIEMEYGGDLSGLRFHDDNESFVIAAIFSTVAFLEATINEFFTEIGSNKDFSNLYGDNKAILFNRLWNWDYPRTASFPILQKYQIALALCDKESFDTGRSPYQFVELLIKLRNYLIHSEPENITLFTLGKIEPQKNSFDKLAGGLMGKFPTNKLFENTSNPFFPYKCLGHGCAEWGLESSLAFTDEFFAEIGLIPRYESMRDKLKTKYSDNENY